MAGKTSQGAKFYHDSTTPTQLVQVEGIDWTSEHEDADVTNLDSTARERLPLSLINNGDVTLTLTWNASVTTHAAIETLRDAGTLQNMKITLPTTAGTATYTFNGFIKSISPTVAVGAKQTAACVVGVNGAITKS